uniref:50S ribosomal protein L25 n=1 Tax=Candidatus Electronema sp. TaxID=2698783 RepID=UPI004055D8C0
MLQVNMSAAKRTASGKGECRRLRMAKKTPAVVYGKGQAALPIEFDAAALHKDLLFIHRRNAVVTLKIEGDEKAERHAVVQEIQKAPTIEQVLHVDFLEIELDKPVNRPVPLRLTGVAKGVEFGGELSVLKQNIVLRGCPLDIPDEIVADITALEKGGAGLTCADLSLPAKVELMDAPSQVCALVL